jgi:hypothetical protein
MACSSWANAGECAAPDALRRNLGEEALDEFEPGGGSRREVQLEARMPGEPRVDLGRLGRPVVVEDEVHVEMLLHAAVDPFQEADELLGAMARLGTPMTRPLFTSRAANSVVVPMALVIVRHGGRATLLHGQACDRSSAWIWLFSSTQSTSARSGGFM